MTGAAAKRPWREGAATACCLGAWLLLGGCAADPPAAPFQAVARVRVHEPAESTGPPAVPPAVADALLPPLKIAGDPAPGGGEGGREPRFEVSAVKLPADQFFMTLMSGTPYEVVLDPGVKGTVSLHLKDVTVPRVMRVVRDIYGYEYERRGRLYKVFPPRLHTRVFQVGYLNVKRSGVSRVGVPGGEPAAPGKREGRGGSFIDTSTEADFWRGLKDTLAGMLGAGEGGRATVDPGAGIVIVHARPADLRRVRAFLGEIQRAARRTVRLEAKVLEVRLNERSQAGIDWTALSPEARAGATAGVVALAAGRHDFAPVIRSLESQGTVRVLSSPHFSTITNQPAVIKAGTDEFFVTGVPGADSRGGGDGHGITLSPFFSGIALDVTAQVGAKGDVMLHVHPAVSEVRNQIKTFTVGNETEKLPLALSSIRESDNVIRAANGEVVMIGGMLQDRSVPKESAVPVLGHIPLLGRLFRHTRDVTSRNELVILLRPTVIGPSVKESARPRDGSRNIAEDMDR